MITQGKAAVPILLIVLCLLPFAAQASIVVSPSSLTFSAQPGGSNPSSQSLMLSLSGGGSFSFSVNVTTSSGGNWLSVTPLSGSGPATLTVSANIAGLPAGNYSGSITISVPGSGSTNVPVTLSLGAINVSPSSLTFSAQAGGANPNSQTLMLSMTGGGSFFFSVSVSTSSGGSWLSASPASGTGPANVSVSVNLGGLSAGTYSGTVSFSPSGGTPVTDVPVTLNVSGASSLNVSPGSLTFTAQAGGSNPSSQSLALSVSGGGTFSFTVSVATSSGGNWLSVSPTSGAGPASVSVSVNITGLAAGTYNGTVTASSSGAGGVSVPVTLNLTGSGGINVSPTSLAFSTQAGGSNPSSQSLALSVSGGGTFSFTVSVATSSGGNWLSVSPASGVGPANVAVAVTITGLAAGTYNGTVTITPSGGGTSTNVPVTLNLTGSGGINVSPTSLTFSAQAGGSNPSSQSLALSVSGGGTFSFTVSAATGSGGNWLSVSPTSGAGPASVSVSVNITGLASGTYTGTVTISPSSGGGATNVSVTLNIAGPATLNVSPSSLTFAGQPGGSNPASQSLALSLSGGGTFSFTVTVATSSGGNWLSVSPASGVGPASVSVSVDIAGLASGTYSAAITLSPSTGGTSTIPVTLNLGIVSLNLSPTTLVFTAQVGGGTVPAQSVQVTSSGASAISWTATAFTTSGGNWLTGAPPSGTTPGTITLSVDITGLAPGAYQGTVTVQSPQASPSTQTVAVTLTVQAPASLSVQPTSMSFQVQAGLNPPLQTILISNPGGGTLNWTARATTQSGGSWLSISATSGSTPSILSVIVNVTLLFFTGLPPGTYQGTVTVQSPQVSPSTQTVSVVLTVLPAATLQLSVQPSSLNFQVAVGAANPPAQALVISNSGGGALSWSAQVATQTGGSWLSIFPTGGATPAAASVSVNASTLAAGTYRGTIIVQVPQATPSTQTVSVLLTVGTPAAAQLLVDPPALSFQTSVGAGNPPAQALRISNARGASLNWTAQAGTASGGNWLGLLPSSGSASATSPGVAQIIVNAGSLPAGTYSGSVQVDSPTTAETKTVAVTLVVSPLGQTLLVSQNGLAFTGVEGGTVVPSQNFGVLNIGQGVMNWTVGTSTLSGGSWLSASPTSGASSGNSLQIPLVDVSVNVSGLVTGQYSGLVRVDATGASNAPQFVSVDLTVLAAGSNPGVLVRPTGMIFAAQAGSLPSPRSASLATASTATVQARVIPGTFDGANWLDAAPRSVTLSAAGPAALAVQTTPGALLPGVYRGALTFLFSDGNSPQVVSVLLSVVSPAAAASEGQAAAGEAAAACVPRQLFLRERKLGLNFLSLVSAPTNIEVELKDDCGNPVPAAPGQPLPDVRATFSHGEPSMPLVHVGAGVYQGTWQPASPTEQVVVKVRADLPPLAPAEVEVLGTLKENLKAAALSAGGIVNAASFAPGAPLSPGAIVAAFGRNLAIGITGAPTLPLDTTLGGARLNVAGVPVPLFFTSPGQINAQLPFDLAPNSRPQAVVRTRLPSTGFDLVTVPATITVAPVSPGIFTTNSSGTGQGAILIAGSATVAGPTGSVSGQDATPVKRGEEFIAIFSTGLGDVTTRPPPGAPASNNPLSETLLKPSVTIGGVPVPAADVNFSGLAPFFVGLYQVNAKVPADAPTGATVPVTITIGGAISNTATIAVQ